MPGAHALMGTEPSWPASVPDSSRLGAALFAQWLRDDGVAVGLASLEGAARRVEIGGVGRGSGAFVGAVGGSHLLRGEVQGAHRAWPWRPEGSLPGSALGGIPLSGFGVFGVPSCSRGRAVRGAACCAALRLRAFATGLVDAHTAIAARQLDGHVPILLAGLTVTLCSRRVRRSADTEARRETPCLNDRATRPGRLHEEG